MSLATYTFESNQLQSDGALRILQLTDLHLLPTPDERYREQVFPDQQLQRVLDDVKQRQLAFDCVVLTGDIANHGAIAAYQRGLALLADTFTQPLFWLPGNHDCVATMQQVAQQVSEQEPRLKTLLHQELLTPAWRILLLDSTDTSTLSAQQLGGGRLSTEELRRVEAALQSADERSLLLMLHHNPYPTGSAWQDPIRLDNAAALLALIADQPQVKGMVCGHLHQTLDGQGEPPLWCAPATVLQFLPRAESLEIDTTQYNCLPGYRYYQLQPNGEIQSQLFRVDC